MLFPVKDRDENASLKRAYDFVLKDSISESGWNDHFQRLYGEDINSYEGTLWFEPEEGKEAPGSRDGSVADDVKSDANVETREATPAAADEQEKVIPLLQLQDFVENRQENREKEDYEHHKSRNMKQGFYDENRKPKDEHEENVLTNGSFEASVTSRTLGGGSRDQRRRKIKQRFYEENRKPKDENEESSLINGTSGSLEVFGTSGAFCGTSGTCGTHGNQEKSSILSRRGQLRSKSMPNDVSPDFFRFSNMNVNISNRYGTVAWDEESDDFDQQNQNRGTKVKKTQQKPSNQRKLASGQTLASRNDPKSIIRGKSTPQSWYGVPDYSKYAGRDSKDSNGSKGSKDSKDSKEQTGSLEADIDQSRRPIRGQSSRRPRNSLSRFFDARDKRESNDGWPSKYRLYDNREKRFDYELRPTMSVRDVKTEKYDESAYRVQSPPWLSDVKNPNWEPELRNKSENHCDADCPYLPNDRMKSSPHYREDVYLLREDLALKSRRAANVAESRQQRQQPKTTNGQMKDPYEWCPEKTQTNDRVHSPPWLPVAKNPHWKPQQHDCGRIRCACHSFRNPIAQPQPNTRQPNSTIKQKKEAPVTSGQPSAKNPGPRRKATQPVFRCGCPPLLSETETELSDKTSATSGSIASTSAASTSAASTVSLTASSRKPRRKRRNRKGNPPKLEGNENDKKKTNARKKNDKAQNTGKKEKKIELSEKTVKRAEKVEKRDEKKNEKAENIPGKEKEIKIVKEILNEEPVIGKTKTTMESLLMINTDLPRRSRKDASTSTTSIDALPKFRTPVRRSLQPSLPANAKSEEQDVCRGGPCRQRVMEQDLYCRGGRCKMNVADDIAIRGYPVIPVTPSPPPWYRDSYGVRRPRSRFHREMTDDYWELEAESKPGNKRNGRDMKPRPGKYQN